ncbi:MAG: hypothetical protein J0I79_27260 [Mesorhizobium sp.]|uniref:hypothetical protein n=1 Tax=Mesorhizobium sp. TaxID=1871066 RepID=UPI001AC967BB|nr:hypothetical protein [Mesorhizobium sp.]MBN9221659.1 hypothetical protein [Mesorhizobium sp.]
MFKVTADDLDGYFGFDPERESDLRKFDGLIREAAPSLRRHFHEGTPAGSAGMRMKMIGYGRFRYSIRSGKSTDWPVIGVALQKSYISVYLSVTVDSRPIVDRYRGRLGEIRSGRNNFSFVRYDELKSEIVAELIAETAEILSADPANPVRYREEA